MHLLGVEDDGKKSLFLTVEGGGPQVVGVTLLEPQTREVLALCRFLSRPAARHLWRACICKPALHINMGLPGPV